MAEQNNPPPPVEVPPEDPALMDPPGRKLETLGDVRRALAAVCRRIERGTIDYKRGQVLVVALNCLAQHMQDARDSVWVKRARLLWEERSAKLTQAEGPH